MNSQNKYPVFEAIDERLVVVMHEYIPENQVYASPSAYELLNTIFNDYMMLKEQYDKRNRSIEELKEPLGDDK